MRPLSLLVLIRVLLVCVLTVGAGFSRANCDPAVQQKGVNLAGAEFNGDKIPGVLFKDYIYPDSAQIEYFAAAGANAIRLPFLWERLQPALNTSLDKTELSHIKTVVALAKARGLCVVLDVHNYGSYRGKAIGSPEVPISAFTDLWKRLALEFNDASLTAYGLMNEPTHLSIAQWATVAQTTVNALRQTGATNLILISGGRWSGAHEWEKQFSGVSNAIAFRSFSDPLHRTYLEVHQYADSDYSGTHAQCVAADTLVGIFEEINRWAKAHHQKLFLGEFGVPPTPACLAGLNAMLAQTQDKAVWGGWTYWTAGSWWGNYPLSIEPLKGEDAAQMTVLKRYF